MNEESGLPLPRGRFVRISFTDQGSGIEPQYLEKIFDPYFTTKEKGSGLGLATAFSIIKSHSGHLTVESEVGRGATFLIYLPATDSQTPAPEAKETGGPVMGRGRILLMDDEALVLKVLGKILRHWGYEAEFARDGRQALDKYAQAMTSGRLFDAVILDLTVPGGMGGMETLRQLQAMDPEVKAIVSSGYSDDQIMANFEEYGFRGRVAKPYRAVELIRIVEAVINQQDN